MSLRVLVHQMDFQRVRPPIDMVLARLVEMKLTKAIGAAVEVQLVPRRHIDLDRRAVVQRPHETRLVVEDQPLLVRAGFASHVGWAQHIPVSGALLPLITPMGSPVLVCRPPGPHADDQQQRYQQRAKHRGDLEEYFRLPDSRAAADAADRQGNAGLCRGGGYWSRQSTEKQ